MSSNATKAFHTPEQLSDVELNTVNGGGTNTTAIKTLGEDTRAAAGTGGLDLASINIARGR